MKSPLALMCLLTIWTAGCADSASVCPAFPPAGPGVADEFAAPPSKPATAAWYQRLKRLDEQLETCRG